MSVASPRILSLSLFLLLSLALSLDFRLVDRFPGTLGYKHRDAPRYKDLRALVAATCIAKHFRPRGSSRLRLPTSQWRGEGCTKGSKGKKGSLALDQLPYPSRSHLLSTCVVRTRLLAVETHPPTTSFQSPLYFPFAPLLLARRSTITPYGSRRAFCFERRSAFSFSISLRGVNINTCRIVSNETNFEGMDSHFRLKFFTSPCLSKSSSFFAHEFRRRESRRNFFPSQNFKAAAKARHFEIAKFPSTLYGLLVHACSGEFIHNRFRILRWKLSFHIFSVPSLCALLVYSSYAKFLPHTFRKTIYCLKFRWNFAK